MKTFASVVILLGAGLSLGGVLMLFYGPIGMAALLPGFLAFAVADAKDRRALRRFQNRMADDSTSRY